MIYTMNRIDQHGADGSLPMHAGCQAFFPEDAFSAAIIEDEVALRLLLSRKGVVSVDGNSLRMLDLVAVARFVHLTDISKFV